MAVTSDGPPRSLMMSSTSAARVWTIGTRARSTAPSRSHFVGVASSGAPPVSCPPNAAGDPLLVLVAALLRCHVLASLD